MTSRSPLAAITRTIRSGQTEALRALIARHGAGILTARRSADRRTPLHIALEQTPVRDEIVRVLLEAGADPNARDRRGRNALHCLTPESAPCCARLLIEHGADPSASDDKRVGATTALARVDALEILEEVLPAHPEQQTLDTLLRAAAGTGAERVLARMLSRGADPNTRLRMPSTALIDAVIAGHLGCVRRLLDAGAKTTPVHRGFSALGRAAERADFGAMEALIAAGASVDGRPQEITPALTAAAGAGHTGVVTFLLEHGANPNTGAKQGRCALLAAAGAGCVPAMRALLDAGADLDPDPSELRRFDVLAQAVNSGSMDAVAFLLDAGIPMRSGWRRLFPPAALAIDNGEARIARYLLERGADPDARSAFGLTPLASAARQYDPAMVTDLLRYGADPNACDDSRQTPLHYALQWHGGRPERERANAPERARRCVEALLAAGADPNRGKRDGSTPVHAAATAAYAGALEALIAHGGRADVRNDADRTAIHLLASPATRHLAGMRPKRLLRQCFESLVEAGADPHARDTRGVSGLESIALHESVELAEELAAWVRTRALRATPAQARRDAPSSPGEPSL